MESVRYTVTGAMYGWLGLLVPVAIALLAPLSAAASWARAPRGWKEGALLATLPVAAVATAIGLAVGVAGLVVLTSEPSQRALALQGPPSVGVDAHDRVVLTADGMRCLAVLVAERRGGLDRKWDVTVTPLALCEPVEPEPGEATDVRASDRGPQTAATRNTNPPRTTSDGPTRLRPSGSWRTSQPSSGPMITDDSLSIVT